MSYIYLDICPKLKVWMVNKSGCKPQKIKNFKQNLKKDENFKSL